MLKCSSASKAMDIERRQYYDSHFSPEVLQKLKPYSSDIGEVIRWTTDFPHQKFHILDNLLHLRDYDFECRRTQITMDNTYWEDRSKYPLQVDWWDMDLVTYDRIERAIRLHDIGRYFVEKGILEPEEHHLGSLFVAMHIDNDPIVWEAVFRHVEDVLPDNSSTVARYVRDLDRIVGAGYVGLIRGSKYYGLEHPMLEEKDEDKVVLDGVMMAIQDRFGRLDESKAKEFFWNNVFPFYESKGDEGMLLLGTLSKIMLDRIVGRDYGNLERKRDLYENEVLSIDNGSFVVEGVMQRLRSNFGYKIDNTVEVLIRTRGGKSKHDSWSFISKTERQSYQK